MKNKKILLFIFLLAACFSLSSCTMPEDNSSNLEQQEDILVDSIKEVEPACIGITRKIIRVINDQELETPESTGSGVIYKRTNNLDEHFNTISYDYYFITNRHVAVNDKSLFKTTLYAYLGPEYPEYPIELLGYDTKVDLAVGKFTSTKYINPVKFGDSSKLEKGNFAFAVGCPEGFDYFNSVTFGAISSPIRSTVEDTDGDGITDFTFEYIQHDVPINPGNSGGGLFNLKGELIGINTLKLASDTIDNMAFSIPSNIVSVLATEYLEVNKEIIRPRLGVTGIEVNKINPLVIEKNGLKEIPDIFETESKYGFYVTNVSENSSIANSIIEKDDIILEVDGLKLYNMNKLSSKLNSLTHYKVGDQVTLTVYDRDVNRIVKVDIILK